MSKTISPWSVVGMFMGSPRLRPASRKRQEKGKQPEVVEKEAEDPKLEDTPLTKANEVVPDTKIAENNGSDLGDSSVGDHYDTPVSGTSIRAEQEHEWTEVSARQEPSFTSPGHPNQPAGADDDMVDVMSQSISPEFLDQEERGTQDSKHYLAEMQRKDPDILSLQDDKAILESRLDGVLGELASIGQSNRDLNEENRRQKEHIELLEVTARALENEKADTKKDLESMNGEMAHALRRIRELEEEQEQMLKKAEKLENTLSILERDKAETINQLEEARRQQLVNTQELTLSLEEVRRDRAETIKQLKGVVKRNQELEELNARHSEERKVAENELHTLQEDNTKMADRLKATLLDLDSAFHRNGEVQNQNNRQAERLQAMERQLQELKDAQKEMNKQPNQRQLVILERRNRMLADQIRRQSEQLSLSRHDQTLQHPERLIKGDVQSEIIIMTNRLNSDIFQTAAHMADSLDFTGSGHLTLQQKRPVIERASITMGRPMVLAMTTLTSQAQMEPNPLLIQVSLQACMVSCCTKIIASWYPGLWDYADFLATIYSRIQGTAGKVYASKWRTLTQAQLKQPLDDQCQTAMKGFLRANLVDALIVVGWYEPESQAQNTLAAFHERLSQIAKLALRLNLAIGEDCECMAIHPNELFDPVSMDDAYEGEEETRGEHQVICTTEMGLKTMTGEVIVKPKVVLQSVLKEETGYDSFE